MHRFGHTYEMRVQMPKLFVSYSHEDSTFVDRLTEDLDLATELDVSIDKRCLKPGDSLTKIFKEIGESDFLVPIISRHSIESRWFQKELRIAIVKEIEESPFKIIPVIKSGENWEQLKKNIPADLKQSLLDKYKCRFDIKSYENAFKELVNALAPELSPEDVYSYIADPEGENPFRRLRAEHFRDPQTFVELFAEPEIAYNILFSPKPAFVEGGRGSGKTMILKSLKADIAPLMKGHRSFIDAKLPYFGVYFRATRDTFGVFENGDKERTSSSAIKGIFYDELILRLSQSLIEELCNCIKNRMLQIESRRERLLCKAFQEPLRLDVDEETLDLEITKKILSEQVCLILDYVRAKSRNEDIKYNVKSLTKDNLVQICRKIKEILPELRDCNICFLIDEYENLKEFQKVVLNTLVKWHHAETFTFKIATKKTGFSTAQTLEGQELEEGHDYGVIDLDFSVGNKKKTDERTRYERYLKNICRNIMAKEGFSSNQIEDILEDRKKFIKKNEKTPDGLTVDELRSEVIEMLSRRGREWDRLNKKQRQRAFSHFSVAAEYRLLGPRNRSFGGFDDFVSLSSGIVRVFLELCGMCYYFARQDDKKVKKGEKIEIMHQTQAAYHLSEYYLWRINKNIEYLGPTLRELAVDIGDIFRQKLLKHLSEPEAAMLSIYNPQKLRELRATIKDEKGEREYTIKRILDVTVLHSIFQEYGKRGGRRGKRISAGQPQDYILNRIFVPALQISPRPRWPTIFVPKDIQGLLDATKRNKTKQQLLKKVTKEMEGKTLLDFLTEEGEE